MSHIHRICRSLAALTRRVGVLLDHGAGATALLDPWCLSCCQGLDRGRCDVIPFGS